MPDYNVHLFRQVTLISGEEIRQDAMVRVSASDPLSARHKVGYDTVIPWPELMSYSGATYPAVERIEAADVLGEAVRTGLDTWNFRRGFW